MANNRNTYQQQNTISVSRNKIIDIATNLDLKKKDYRVFLILLTTLSGYRENPNNPNQKDPRNFKRIDFEKIADTLAIEVKDVKKAIHSLYDEGYIEIGSNDTIKKGYRFTF